MTIQSSLTFIQNKLGNNITLDENYIKKLISLEEQTNNSTDLYFYLLIILPIVFYKLKDKLDLKSVASNFGSNSKNTIFGIIILVLGYLHVIGSYNLTVIEDNNANTMILKRLIYPLTVLIGIFCYSISNTDNKKSFLIFSLILGIPILIAIILNTVSIYNTGLAEGISGINIGFGIGFFIILVIFLFVFRKKDKLNSSSNSGFFSFFLWTIAFLVLGRVINFVNRFILNANAGNYVLESYTPTSNQFTTNVETNMNTIIDEYGIQESASKLFSKLTDYKVTESDDLGFWKKFQNFIYYSLGSLLNFVFFWLLGNTINTNINQPRQNINKFAIPILGFNEEKIDDGKFHVKNLWHQILGTLSTKLLLNGFSSNNSSQNVGSTIINVFLTGFKFIWIVILGEKYNKWYEYILDPEVNDYKKYALRILFAGIDIDEAQSIYNTNKAKKSNKENNNKKEYGRIKEDQFFKDKNIFGYSSMFLLVGALTSLFTGMNYLTNNSIASFVLTLIKYILIIVIMIIYYKNKNKVSLDDDQK